ncbi:MAG: YicC/YloC family endoribonuclease [Planctomycetota bacterium]
MAVASMTGAGIARGETEFGQIEVLVRSVNGRGLTTKVRTFGEWDGWDREVERVLRARFVRGSFHLTLRRQEATDAQPSVDQLIDQDRFGEVAAQLAALAREHGVADPSFSDVVRFPGVLGGAADGGAGGGAAEEVRDTKMPEAIRTIVDQAFDLLSADRDREGSATCKDMLDFVTGLESERQAVDARRPEMIEEHRERLLQRIESFLEERGQQVEDDVLVREVALFADKTDTAEELQRLGEHLAELRRVLQSDGAVGRRLEFLLQECLREVNTIGSKSSDTDIARRVVEMKTGLDRLKEQAANLE